MLSRIVLDYEKDPEVIDKESLFKYEGPKDLNDLRSLEAIADTREMTLSYLGDVVPALRKLRLNNSQIPSIRDISAQLVNLRFLSLAHCEIVSLDGICTLSKCLEELYLAYNHISDLSELIGLPKLRVLDLEENEVPQLAEIELLSCCTSLKALTLLGNPASRSENYREEVRKYLPQLIYLDEKRLKGDKPAAKPAQVQVAPLEVTKIEKGPKCGVKPSSADGRRDENKVMSEMVEDRVGERPPTARAYGAKGFHVAAPGGKGKKIVTPKIARPQSACRAGSRMGEADVSAE
jgi:hypothetical protein